LRIVVRDEIDEDSELRRAWNELVLRMRHPEVFYTYEWGIAVQRAYRTSLTPLIFLGYDGDSLVGVAALARKNRDQVVFLSADTADYCEFLSEPESRGEFVPAVLSGLKDLRADRVVLTNLPADSLSVRALSRAASKVPYHLHTRPAYACAQVVMGGVEERVLLKQSVLEKKRLRRNLRELEKRGPVTLEHATDWHQIEPLLQPFACAHAARFLEIGKISSLIPKERRVFLTELARELSKRGWVAFSRLLVGDLTAAWNYGFRFEGSWFWYQPTVNDLFGDFSPGHCLLTKIVESACDSKGISVVDLGLGAEGYKDRFATATKQTLYCELNRSFLAHSRAVVRYRAASLATLSPRVEKHLRAAIAVVKDFRSRLSSTDESWPRRLTKHARRSLFHLENVLFFEWPLENRNFSASNLRLRPLNSEMVGTAELQYGSDPASSRFLMRSAQRLRSGEGSGYVLVTADDMPVHFCWARDFEAFQMAELNCTLRAPCQNAVMIFDCFTPQTERGHGFFGDAIALLARELSEQGKSAWIFAALSNQPAVRGIKKTAFQYRFKLRRKRILFVSRSEDSVPSPIPIDNQNTVSAS
jgi:CelD/BcsL family acetyltransferase involved in cellulose biosynthesis